MDLTPRIVKPINIKTPLAFSPAGAFLTNDTTLDAISDDLANLLKTNWGERVMRYKYGANLRPLLFENTQDIEQAIKDRITNAVETEMPYVAIIDISVNMVGEHGCYVQVAFGLAQSELNGQVGVTIR